MKNCHTGFFTINYLTDAVNKIKSIVDEYSLKIDDIPSSLLSSIIITGNYDALRLFCVRGYVSKRDIFGLSDPCIGWVLTAVSNNCGHIRHLRDVNPEIYEAVKEEDVSFENARVDKDWLYETVDKFNELGGLDD